MFTHKKKWNIKVGVEKKKKKIPKRFWVYLVLIVFCIVGIVYVLRLPEYQIKNVVISGAVLTRENDVKNIALEYLSYNYFYFIPQSNVWIYPKSKMLQKIKSLSSIDDASIDFDKKESILKIKVKERKHEYVWCTENNDCYYMDKEGYVFAKAPTFEGSVFLTFKGQIDSDPVGENFLAGEKMSELLLFISDLKKINLNVNVVNVISSREVKLILDSKAVIIVSIEEKLDETFKNVETLVDSREFITASGGIQSIQYIDMRYGKKAFWK